MTMGLFLALYCLSHIEALTKVVTLSVHIPYPIHDGEGTMQGRLHTAKAQYLKRLQILVATNFSNLKSPGFGRY